MMFRSYSILALLIVALLTACDFGTPTPEAVEGANATPTVATGEKPLGLRPVQVETTASTAVGNLDEQRTVNLPPGFGIEVFAAELPHVRQMALSPDGVLYATVRAEGRVVRLPDAGGDGAADRAETVADNLQGVHGIAFHEGKLYVATEVEIIRLEDDNGDHIADRRVALVNDMPTGGTGRAGANHSTRTLKFGPDGKLYVSIGSSCNACTEVDSRRAAISRYTIEGKLEKVFAKGLRNSVGMAFHPVTGELWAVNNGRDGLGEDLPPEGIYKVAEDADYGWPFCYGYRTPDTSGEVEVPPGHCEQTGVPEFTIEAHSAPLGLTFYDGEQFPMEFRGDMFLTSHGSWDRKVRIGYKVMRVRFKENQPDKSAGDLLVEDFATGWLTDPVKGDHWGRPVDLLVAPDGSLFVTDDAAMVIYRIYYKGE